MHYSVSESRSESSWSRKFDSKCFPRTGSDTFHTQNTFCSVFPFSGVIGYINIHRTNFFTFSTWNTLLFVTLNPDYREITHRFQKDRDRTNILTERSVIFKSECQNNPHNIIQNIPHNKSYKHDFFHISYVIQKKYHHEKKRKWKCDIPDKAYLFFAAWGFL